MNLLSSTWVIQGGIVVKTIILAGGRSRRMGQNKALMKLDGVRVIDRMIAEFKHVSDKLILIVNEPDIFKDVQAIVFTDERPFKGKGPLAGLYTGLTRANGGACLVVACDMPFASANMGASLVAKLQKNKVEAVVPVVNGQLQPLFAAYDAELVHIIKETLQNGKRSLRDLLDQVHVHYEQIEQETAVFWNMNTVEDYKKAHRMVERGFDQ